jgi:hypothetical protein
VLNVKKLVHDAPIEIAKGYILRRADNSEIAYIKEFIPETFGGKSNIPIWETEPKKSGKQPKLPKKLFA